jgi:hypothetical protein
MTTKDGNSNESPACRSPTFVAIFGNGVQISMILFHNHTQQTLELRRALQLSVAACETRERNRRAKAGETTDAPIAAPPVVAERLDSSDTSKDLAKAAGDQLYA